jgi:hypothetical protein
MSEFTAQPELDPLGSAYPVPWESLLQLHAQAQHENAQQTLAVRSPDLRSPDGRYIAYSRIQLESEPDFLASRAQSVLFLEDAHTRDLQTVIPRSPISQQLLAQSANPNQQGRNHLQGAVSMLVPVAWSSCGDLLLSRVFEAILSSEVLSDYGVVWDAKSRRVYTLSPTRVPHSHTILLGWSQSHPQQVLFKAGVLGDPDWPIWRVDLQGRTVADIEPSKVSLG